MSELPFTLTGVPVVDLIEYTLVITGGAPNSEAVPWYYDGTQWKHVFDPQVIPFILLDANGEKTFIFNSGSTFLTSPFKVLGTLANGQNGLFDQLWAQVVAFCNQFGLPVPPEPPVF